MSDTLQLVGSSINQLQFAAPSSYPRVFPSLLYSSVASGRIVRISKIEIIGRKRRNKNSKVKKNPIVPMNIPQSHIVGWYIPQDDGK